MRQLLPIVLLFGLSGFAGSAPAQERTDTLPPLPATTVKESQTGVSLANIEAYLNGITTMTAKFTQLAPDGTQTTGTLSMERPGRVRFEYSGDKPILIVSDGKIVNLIDYQLGQVTRWPVDETPLAFLLSKDIALDKNVEVTSMAAGAGPDQTLVTAHDPEKPEQGTLTLFFTGRGGKGNEPLKLRAWEVVDAQGSLTTVRLSDVETNVSLDKSLWTFDDPRNERFQRRHRR